MLKLDDEQLSYFQEEEKKVDAKDYGPEFDAQTEQINSLKSQIDSLSLRIQELPLESNQIKKQLDQAEIYYGSDGRIKSIKIGSLGAVVSRDNDGKMRSINFKEIGVM